VLIAEGVRINPWHAIRSSEEDDVMGRERHDRIVGSIVAGAIGDALGAPIEFDSLDTIRRQHGPSGLTSYAAAYGRTGAITDDTQMTLFTADGILRAGSSCVDDIVESIRRSYLAWLRTQDPSAAAPDARNDEWSEHQALHAQRAPGATCMTSLYAGGHGSPESPLNDSKGCGGVMRVAPVAALPGDWFEVGARAAALTHGHPSGYLSAGVLSQVVAEVVRGAALLDGVESAKSMLTTWAGHEETKAAIDAAVALAASGDVTPEAVETLGGGWVGEEALAIGVCCALVAHDMRTGLLLAVNHSGDSDSTGSIAGNLLGAVHGTTALPSELLEGLEARQLIEQVAHDVAAVGRASG
jgi:ADP-ribosylglycohydrolase